MSIIDWFTNPQGAATDAATQAAGNVADAGKSFFSTVLTAPFKAIMAIPKTILGSLSGFAHGAFGSLWNGVKYSAIALGVNSFAPSIADAYARATGGEEKLRQLREHRRNDSVPGVLLDSAKEGFGLAALMGGASGAIEGGGLLGGGVVMATVAAVTIGAMHRGDVTVADTTGTATPPPTLPDARPRTTTTQVT